MESKGYITVEHLCTIYELKIDFFNALEDHQLLQIEIFQEVPHVHETNIDRLEKIVRLYQDLQVNLEGIDVILNLLEKVSERDLYITQLENKLRLLDKDES